MEIQNPEMFIEGKMISRKSAAQNLHNKILETPIWGKDLARNMAEKCRVKIEFSLGPSRHEILMDFAMPKLRSESQLFTHDVETHMDFPGGCVGRLPSQNLGNSCSDPT